MYWNITQSKRNASATADWLSCGGTAHDGTTYGPPSSATAWGKIGCPLVPRIYRIHYGQRTAPPLMKGALKAPNLTLRDLDSELLGRFNMVKIPSQFSDAMRALFYLLPVLGEVAIPSGIPVSWLMELPLKGRIRNALSRYLWPHEMIVKEPIKCAELMIIPAVGKNSLHELLCVLESAESKKSQAENELPYAGKRVFTERHVREQNKTETDRIQAEDSVLPVETDVYYKTTKSSFQEAVYESARQAIRAGLLQFDSLDSLPAIVDEENEVVCSVSVLGVLLRHFVTWALAETDAQTIGEAISQSMFRTETSEEWQAIAELDLNQAGFKPEHPYTILESWVDNLSDREQRIFNTRVSPLEGITSLQDLGAHFGVTRERVRQMEKRVRKKFTIMLKRESARPIRWRAETIKQNIGVAAPLASVEGLLSSLNGKIDFRRIVLELAGPYDLLNEWLVLRSALGSEPTTKIRELADEMGFIEPQLAAQALKNWGLDQSLHEEWLMRDGKVRMLNGRLVRWDGSLGDKLVIALAEIGRPATIDELLEYTQENRAKSSAANALSNDTRAIKVNRKEWALVSWGLSEYSGIAISIRNVLKRQKQPVSVEKIVALLRKDMGLKEGSIRAYCQAPMFIIENGAVRLRRDDERYEYDNVSLQKAKGVFALGPRRVSRLIEVDSELLRGSGRSLTYAAGSVLGVAPNQSLTFTSRDGDAVTVTFPEGSITGPWIGSLRSLAISSSARIGDQLTVTLDRADMSVTAVATDLTQHEPGWQLVFRLTGLGDGKGLEELAAALQVKKGEVRALLRNRRDYVVADALPTSQVSSEFDRALASLEAQVQQTQGSLR